MTIVTQTLIPLLALTLSVPLSAQEKQPKTRPDANTARQTEQDAQQAEDPFANDHQANSRAPGNWRKDTKILPTQVRIEWYEADTKFAIQTLDRWQPTADAAAYRKKLLSHADTNIVAATLAQLDVGERTTLGTMHEMIYPTEYTAPKLPLLEQAPSTPSEQGDFFKNYLSLLNKTGLIPVAFETRNTGVTIQMALEPVTSETKNYDLSIVPEKVQFIHMVSHGKKDLHAQMPLFSTVRSDCTLRLGPGQWRLTAMQPAIDKTSGQSSSTRSLLLFVRLDLLGK